MTTRFRRTAASASALAAASGFILAAALPANAATTPPWQSTPPANQIGALTFYDGAGNPMSSGDINNPIASYALGSGAGRSGDTKATLFGYLPKNGVDPGAWGGEALTGATSYPNTAAPAPVGNSTNPVVTIAPSDFTLANVIADFPNTDTTSAYAGLYELRLRTSGPGTGADTHYQAADVLVSGSTWQLVYPTTTKTATTTTLTATPASGATAADTITLKATVSPLAAGTVQFLDGSSNLGGAVTVASGVAQTSVTLPAGGHNLSAVFTPTSSAYAGSTGTLSYTVGAAPATATTTALGVPTTAPAYSPVALTATITPTAAAGAVQFFDGTTSLGSASVTSGSATLTYSLFAEGTHTLKAVFTPTDATAYATSTSDVVTYTASAPAGPAPSNSNVQTEVSSGPLTISSPFGGSSVLDLGPLKSNGTDTKLATNPTQFGDSTTPIQVTDHRSGGLGWTAYAQASDFTSGTNVINAQNLGLTGIQYVLTPGNALTNTNVSVFDNTGAAAVSATDTGTAGLKGTGHKFASAANGFGTVGFTGTLNLTAPTSTAAGTYGATLTFTIG